MPASIDRQTHQPAGPARGRSRGQARSSVVEAVNMNHMPLRALTSVAQVRRPTQRALAKQRTRHKILAAARGLFTEKGYEAATIRDIAAAAGMSTGAVFASFTDKSDLFKEIVAADHDALFEAMRAVAAGPCVDKTLVAMFGAGYALHLDELPLLQATISATWSPQLGPTMRGRLGRGRPITETIAEVLTQAVERGELSRRADVSLLSQMLWDAFIANFRHAAFEAWGLEALKGRAREQIQVILAGSRAA